MLTRQGTTLILLTCLRLALGASCPGDWSAVSTAQLSSLDPVCFAQATSADLAALPGPSCAGFDATRVSQLETTVDGNEACGGLSPACASAFPEAAAAGLGKACVASLSCEFVANLTGAALGRVPPSSIAGLDMTNIAGLGPTCAFLNGAQVAELGKSELSYACAGLTASCASSLSPAGAGGLESECLGYLSIGAVSALGPEQVTAIPASSWSGWTRENIAGLGESCAGVMYDQFAAIGMSMLTNDACAGLTPECAQHLPTSSLATVSSKCVRRLSKDFVAALSESHVVAMPAPAFAGITRDNVGGLRESCAGLDNNQTQFLGSHETVCHLLDLSCMRWASVSAFSGFVETCTREWSVEQALTASLDKVLAMGGRGHGGFSAAVWAALVREHGSALVEGLQATSMTRSISLRTTQAFGRLVSNGTLATMHELCPQLARNATPHWLQMSLSPANASLCISDDMFGRMVIAYPGLRPEHLKLIPHSAFRAVYFLKFMTDDAIGALSDVQVFEVPPEALGALGDRALLLNESAVFGIRPRHMERLRVTGRWSCPQIRGMQIEVQQMAVCKQPEMSYDTNCKVSKCLRPGVQSGASRTGAIWFSLDAVLLAVSLRLF
eukprot:m51a1_g13399 hypothetical protein (613) ;mRNA; r:7430-9268